MKEFCTKKNLFGKEIEIVMKNIEPFLGEGIVDGAYNYGLRLQKIFNFFDEESELSRLNKKKSLKVSYDLLRVIKYALKLCKLTQGKYDIILGKQILQRKQRIQENSINCSYKDIKINGNKIILNNKDAMIDLGSIAKGYIVDKMVEHLISKGVLSGLIDARGDISVFGQDLELIDIQHPREKDEIICTIKLKNSSVATSGDYNQYYGNYKKTHIINSKDVISVSVVASTLEEADVYATALFVVDEKERENIIKQNKKIKVLTIDYNFNMNYYNGFKDLIVGDKQ